MEGVVVDANVFLSTLVHRNDEQRDAAKALLLKTEDGEVQVILPDHETYTGHTAPHHQAPLISYFVVFFALMGLTILTVWVSRIDLGALNTAVALAIAVVKALVVILWFMHVIHSPA